MQPWATRPPCSYLRCNTYCSWSKRGDVGHVQLTAGRDASERGPAAALVALVAGIALSALFLAMHKPSLGSPAIPPKADMLDSLHGALVRNQHIYVVSCVGHSCTYGKLAIRLLGSTAEMAC